MAGTAAGFPSRHGGPVGTHRSYGHPIGKGAELDRLLAELMGRETGVNQGKGGSMHLSDFSIGSLGETSIVGSGIPVAAGAALGSKMQGDDRVTLCFFGDGASNQGTFHEALNLAAIWSLPVVYVCENNAYGELTAASYAVAVENVSSRAVAYGMPGATVDGQDVLAVYEAVNEAVSRARRGGGGHHQRCREPTRVPIIVELRRDLDRHVPPRTRDPVACDLHCGRAWPQTWQGGSVGAPDPHQVIDEVTVDCYRDDKAASAFAVVVEECLDGRSVPARVVGFATELTAVEHMGDRRGVVVGIRDGGRRHRVALCDVEVDAAAHPNRPC